MPFITLNGLTVQVALGGEETPEAIGFGMRRSHTGVPLTDARAYKRKWRFSTIPGTEQTTQALVKLIQGRGVHLPFSSQSLYASNGLPTVGSDIVSYHGDGVDGAATVDVDDATAEKFGESGAGYSVAVEPGTTNVLAAITSPDANSGANIVTGTDTRSDTSGFTVVDGGGAGTPTIGTGTASYWQGARSLTLTPAAALDGVITSYATVSANATVTASVYLKVVGGSSTTWRLKLFQGAGSLLATGTTTTCVENGWKRLVLTSTLTGGNTLVAMQVEAVNNATNTCRLDGWQIEELGYPTSWTATTRAAGLLSYSGFDSSWQDVSVAMWVAKPTSAIADTDVFFGLGDFATAANYMAAYRSTGNNNLRLDAGAESVTYSSTPWNGAWHHIAGVVRQNPETGENAVTLYFDGASVGTPSASTTFTGLTSTAKLYIGRDSSGNQAQSTRIAHVRAVPYAMTAAQVLALYNLSSGGGAIPKITMGGNVIPETSATVIGEVNSVNYKGHSNTGAWRDNGRIVDFTLYEV